MEEEKKEEKIVAEIEEMPDTVYKKEHITFVIRKLPAKNAERWSKWCKDWGLELNHHTAFGLALDILEGKTKNLLEVDSRIATVEKLLQAHDGVLETLAIKFNEGGDEELDANDIARIQAEKRAAKKKQREEEEKKKVK